VLSGLNGAGEHTLTVFRVARSRSGGNLVSRIADIMADGAITVVERERGQAYRLGRTDAESFDIVARNGTALSSDGFGQTEVTYTYNSRIGIYEQTNIRSATDSQVEEARTRGILSGGAKKFEEFLQGVWYSTEPDMPNSGQYIYFDTNGREIIFYGDDAQQVYSWLSSAATRYGLYVASRNISVTTLRRLIDIELTSMDSIRVRVSEDVRMNIGTSAQWDGLYRKLPYLNKTEAARETPYIDAAYNSSIGRAVFSPDGGYRIEASGTVREGRYLFFTLDGQEYVEMREDGADGGTLGATTQQQREIYLVTRPEAEGSSSDGGGFSLERVLLGVSGIQYLDEEPVLFTVESGS
jgi:hypothetical protein